MLVVHNPSSDLIEKFFAKIVIDPTTECWNWNGSKDKVGYGHFRYLRRVELAHRFAWAWLIGPLQRGRRGDIPVLDHIICDNPSCVNPDHLRLVTNTENLHRTNSVGSINRRKTHCIRDHLITGKQKSGRLCVICKRVANTAYRRNQGIPTWQEFLAKRNTR